MLKLADNLKLPVDAATQTFAFIGRKGSGKTYGAGKLTELLIAAGVQTIVLDLVGKWWGLRLAADGKSPGIDIPMLGGLRGDIPLESAGGALVAESLLDSGRSAILDLSQFSKSGRQEFAYRFGQRLWQSQKAQLNPVPVHLVIEESQLIVPENIPAGGKGEFLREMYGVFEEIIRLGRNYGIGITLITQRPQSVAKEVLNQAEPLLVFQLTGKHERKAIKEWIQHQGMDENLTDTLPAQEKGKCWFWSPEWLGELKQIKIAPKWTFDSTATPKVGEKAPKARAIKALDLSDLQTKMAETIERAKADDPKKLKARIAELEKQLKQPSPAKSDPAVVDRAAAAAVKAREAEWVAHFRQLERKVSQAGKVLSQIAGLAGGTDLSVPAPLSQPATFRGHNKATVSPESKHVNDKVTSRLNPLAPKVKTPPSNGHPTGEGGLSPRQQRFLDTAATLATLGREVTRDAIAAWNGIHPRTGSFGEDLKVLADAGLITNERGAIQVTDAGADAAGQVDPAEAIERAKSSLGNRQRKFFEMIVAVYPDTITREQIAAQCDPPIHPRTGSFGEDLAALVGRGLVDGQRGNYRARDILFVGSVQ